jgi:hypothetical protein
VSACEADGLHLGFPETLGRFEAIYPPPHMCLFSAHWVQSTLAGWLDG